jgi:hypothetical protein
MEEASGSETWGSVEGPKREGRITKVSDVRSRVENPPPSSDHGVSKNRTCTLPNADVVVRLTLFVSGRESPLSYNGLWQYRLMGYGAAMAAHRLWL